MVIKVIKGIMAIAVVLIFTFGGFILGAYIGASTNCATTGIDCLGRGMVVGITLGLGAGVASAIILIKKLPSDMRNFRIQLTLKIIVLGTLGILVAIVGAVVFSIVF